MVSGVIKIRDVDLHDEHGTEWLRRALDLGQGETPFPWQLELLRRFLRGEAVTSLDIPTGLGKTATMGVWLVARALGAPLPRKLVYVVDRRAVVDQATDVAESLRAWVSREDAVAAALGLGDRPLPISTLRGQHVDNREWLEDPSSPAIVIGTIDMVGSRILFSGYGVSSKMRPYHAGLLATDTLLVLDEAHLVPAFEDLLQQIASGGETLGPKDEAERRLIPPFQLLSLSATGRRSGSTVLALSDADRHHPVVSKRLNAKKVLSTVELAGLEELPEDDACGKGAGDAAERAVKGRGRRPSLASALANHAWELTKQGSTCSRCLVYCDSRKDAVAVADELRNLADAAGLPRPTIELFVGGRRVRERVQARNALAQLGFLAARPVRLERSAFVIATSAGEVGVDLDADDMVCDLVGWERMVQRLGRVNRRGDGDARVVVVIPRAPAPSGRTKDSLDKREDSVTAKARLDVLTTKLSALEGDQSAVSRAQRRSGEAKSAEGDRKQAEKTLKKDIAACRKRIKCFKDADARAVAHHDAEVERHRALGKLLEAVGEGGSLGPGALIELRQRQDLAQALGNATTAEPLRPELTRALVDAWSMTSLDMHPGRPDVEPWLRGFRPNDRPQTTLLWRRHLPVRQDADFDPKAARRFFEAAPPHTSEQLEVDTDHALSWLIERAVLVSGTWEGEDLPVAIALSPRGDVKGWRTLGQITAARSNSKKETKEAKKACEQHARQLQDLLAGSTVVIDARLGGLTDGLLDEKAGSVVEAADDSSVTWLVRSDVTDVPVTGFRVRALCIEGHDDADTDRRGTPGDGWVRRHLFVRRLVDGQPSAALVIDGWVGDAATEDERAEARRPQSLDEHHGWAEECARGIARRIGLDQRHEDLLALAARIHDEGKSAARWQRAFRAPIDGRPYAKTNGPIDLDILDGYRHELGSLAYVERDLPPPDRDLLMHLIAAHHGHARPVIGTSGCDDAPPSIVEDRAREVALRFARLSRRWGPWGLAWWEALLRAADQAASRRNQQGGGSTARKGDA